MINILKDYWYALTAPEKYREFMNYKTWKLLLYVFFMVFISGIFTFGMPFAKFISDGGIRTIIEEQIPEFRADSANGFWIEEPIEIDEYNFLIKATSDVVYEDITDTNGEYGTYEYIIAVDREQIYLKSPEAPEIIGRFDEMGEFSVSKKDIFKYIPVMYMVMLCIVVFSIFIDFGYYFICAFVVSWGAGIFASFMHLKLHGKKLFKMAVYAGTLSYILQTVQIVIGKNIPNFSLFSMILSFGYMYFALKDYRDSGIEKSQEEEFKKDHREE